LNGNNPSKPKFLNPKEKILRFFHLYRKIKREGETPPPDFKTKP